MAQVTLTLSFDSFEAAQAFMADRQINANQATVQQETRSQFEILMDELEDPRFTLRSFNELIQKTGFASREVIEQELRINDVDFVVRRRRSDGAMLVGLEDRN